MRQGWAGAFSDKPTKISTNAPYAEELQKIFSKKPFTTNISRALADKGKWVTGNPYMSDFPADISLIIYTYLMV